MEQQQQSRAQSFSHPPRQGGAVDPPQQQQGQPPRPSPFASSGPVAMVHQIRPGAAPGQFPGVAVRTNPTQLATPLVTTRRLSGATPTPTAATGTPFANASDLLFPSPPPSNPTAAFDPFASGNNVAPPPFQMQAAPLSNDRYNTIDQIPAQTTSYTRPNAPPQAAADLFPRVERSSANTLVGASPSQSPATQSFNQNYDNLFGPPEPAAPTPTSSAPVRSTQSFSYGHTYDEQQQQHGRAFSQPPPPSAPFLGYADSSRTQSSTSTAPSPRAALLQGRTSSGTLPPPSPRIHAGVRSADELLEEFLHVSVEDQYLGGVAADGALFPEYVPQAKKLTLADVPDTVEGLEELYRQKRWKTLTKKSLSMLQNPSNEAQLTLEIKSWWLAGLIKDGHYDNATSVLDQIGNLDDPLVSSPDSFVSLRLRLLEAMLHKYKGNNAEHEKKLFQLIARLKHALAQSTTSEDLGISTQRARKWLRIAQFALVNHLVLQNKFSLAIRVSATIETKYLEEFEKVITLSRLGRVHLQMGDLTIAENFFRLARRTAERGVEAETPGCYDPQTGALVPQLQGRLLLNDGLLFFAQNKLQEALGAFDGALNLEVTRVGVPPTQKTVDDEESLFLEEDLVCVAVNNFAICALYCCDVKGAVAALERMIRSNPVRFLNAVVVFNLSSLYDLIYDNPTSASRKEMMKKLAELYDLEHIDPTAFRV